VAAFVQIVVALFLMVLVAVVSQQLLEQQVRIGDELHRVGDGLVGDEEAGPRIGITVNVTVVKEYTADSPIVRCQADAMAVWLNLRDVLPKGRGVKVGQELRASGMVHAVELRPDGWWMYIIVDSWE